MDYEKPLQSHPKSIWTFPSRSRGKVHLWLPYLEAVEKTHRAKRRYRFSFHGGDVEIALPRVAVIMLYGKSEAVIPAGFFWDCALDGVVVLAHRRGDASLYLCGPGMRPAAKDVLTPQILARENEKKRVFLARTLIRHRFRAQEARIRIPQSVYTKLAATRSTAEVRAIEAYIAQRYWIEYARDLGLEHYARRDDAHPINQALNATSVFLAGILLRWIGFHGLSPAHGFLHEPTAYTALVYDLMEPYRSWLELAVERAYHEAGETALVERSIEELKGLLSEVVTVPSHQGVVARAHLLHGVVLALRAYLIGDMARIVIPVEGAKKGGRPIKLSYDIPGLQRNRVVY